MIRVIGFDEIKKIELDILIYIRMLCEENNLRYYLAYGTLLGAIRHKGFIPWDDDIDIYMPRNDYEQFIQLCKQQKGNYDVISCDYDKEYYYEFAKVVDNRTKLQEYGIKPIQDLGVYVDIFPLDGLPRKYKLHIKILWVLVKLRALSTYVKIPVKNTRYRSVLQLICMFLRKMNSVRIARLINKIARKYNYDSARYVACAVSSAGIAGVFEKTLFENKVKVAFENEMFDAPGSWEDYLHKSYGDFMQLPPLEKQTTHHFFDAYWVK